MHARMLYSHLLAREQARTHCKSAVFRADNRIVHITRMAEYLYSKGHVATTLPCKSSTLPTSACSRAGSLPTQHTCRLASECAALAWAGWPGATRCRQDRTDRHRNQRDGLQRIRHLVQDRPDAALTDRPISGQPHRISSS